MGVILSSILRLCSLDRIDNKHIITSFSLWTDAKDNHETIYVYGKINPERAIGNHKAETVLDFFGGSGSTLIACEKINRKARLMELDEKYVDVIINRWQDFTGKEAIHENGKTYNELKVGADNG